MEEADRPSEADIARLVDTFYARVKRDPVLGPIFAATLGDGDAAWEEHKARLRDFWSSVMLISGRYHGDPFSAHLKLPALSPDMFGHWLGLFGQTCDSLFEPRLAASFRTRAERIARSLRTGIFERLPAREPGPAQADVPAAGHAPRAALPPGCELYRTSPVFTGATIPAGLLRSHRTAPGVWALIHVLEGRLRYRMLEPFSESILEPSQPPCMIEPGVLHEIAPLGPVRFQVTFHRSRRPGT